MESRELESALTLVGPIFDHRMFWPLTFKEKSEG
jgi:hypothetical protein